MKVTSAFCDIHADFELAAGGIKTLSPVGDVNTLDTARCTHPTCIRNYTQDFGYFDARIGESFMFGDMARKHRCGWNHHLQYMVLTKLDGVLTWVCPVEKCRAIKPYGAVGPLTLHLTGRAGNGPNIAHWNNIIQYDVRGLPAGEEAWINRVGGQWSTLRCTNGIQGQLTGEYNDLKEALEALTAEFEIPSAV